MRKNNIFILKKKNSVYEKIGFYKLYFIYFDLYFNYNYFTCLQNNFPTRNLSTVYKRVFESISDPFGATGGRGNFFLIFVVVFSITRKQRGKVHINAIIFHQARDIGTPVEK